MLLFSLLVSLVATSQSWNPINFDVVSESCNNSIGEIYISEIYDCQSGGYGVVEIYNPTNSAITLTGTYKLKKYALPGATSLTIDLVGQILPYSTFVFVVLDGGGSSNNCLCPSVTPNQSTTNSSLGFNAQDKIELLKNITVVDTWIEVNNTVGYSYSRKSDAIAPKVIHDENDWSYTDQGNNTIGCSELGEHYTPISIIEVERFDNPPDYTMCKIPARVRILLTGGSGQYQGSINGSAFTNHGTTWQLPDLTLPSLYTIVIRDLNNPNCSITFTFEIEPDSTPLTSPVTPL